MSSEFSQNRRPLYRSRHGLVFGVCRGLARYMDVNVFGLRLLVVILAFVTGFWPVIFGYVVLALVLKKEPVMDLRSDADAEFYNSYLEDRSLAVARLKRTFEDLQRRVSRMESIVTSRDYNWEERLKQ